MPIKGARLRCDATYQASIAASAYRLRAGVDKDTIMRPTDRLPFTQWADVNRTDRFISIEPLSGYRTIQREDEGHIIYLSPEADDDALGRALLEALDKSRFIWPPDEPEFFKWQRYVACYRNWQKGFHAPLRL